MQYFFLTNSKGTRPLHSLQQCHTPVIIGLFYVPNFIRKKYTEFVQKGSMNNKLALVQGMAWHQTGDKPLQVSINGWMQYIWS